MPREPAGMTPVLAFRKDTAASPREVRAPRAAASLIRAAGLSLDLGGRSILETIDLMLNAGEIVTLIGPNGAGKTTLARVLLGLLKPTRGSVTRAAGLRIGYVPQRFAVDPTIPINVSRFLTLGVRASAEAVSRVLAEVGAEKLGERPLSALSGGEFQRVSLARALIGEPQFLMLDEPVQGVDYSGEAQLYGLIGEIRDRRGCGILLISHDLHIVLGASDRVVCLNRHICCEGVPETVAAHPEYMRMFGREAGRAMGIYRHEHDHEHDLSGAVRGPGCCADHSHD
jgi:zinc transport system ATP-binding protein